ncbi:hydroxymethylglutaryl-CoA lyase [Aestuariibius sp. HNIBRBA575]|uniref:hydroxymethylglutaryl-CoA lyase n=1 Tax=Aestuariibius sp. HNIBRBA575 TaxID=3233343 RepID=UPI0034A3992C
MNKHVHIYEVGPRDGLQNEKSVISLADKVQLIDTLSGAGLHGIEVGSFVSPKWVPQMADTDQVISQITYAPGVKYAVLVPNMRGWDGFETARAGLAQSPDEIAVFISASEGFSKANLNCTIADSVDRLGPVVQAAIQAGITVRGYVSCVTDCPYDGPTAPADVARAVEMLRGLAVMPISLGDTIGRGTPDAVDAMLQAVLDVAPADELAGHFHDTGGQALDNIEVSLERGLRVFDAAVGGLGGCPYAPGAQGNVATELVLDRLDTLGFETGVNRDLINRAGAMALAMRAK